MANIPGLRYDQSSPGPANNQAQATPQEFGAGVGAAMQGLGEKINDIAIHLKDTYDETQAAKATSQGTADLQDYTNRLNSGGIGANGELEAPPPPDQHEELFQKEVDRINKQAENELGGRALRMFNAKFGEFVQRQAVDMRKNTLSTYKEEIQANTEEANDRDANTFTNASDLEKPGIQADVFGRIDRLTQAGVWTAVQGLQQKKQWAETTQMTEFSKIVRANPLDAMLAVKNGEFGTMPPDVQEKMYDKAVNAYEQNIRLENAQAEKTRIEADRLQKKIEDQTEEDLWKKKFGGQLSPAEVNARRGQLSTDGYVRLMKVASGVEESPTNRAVYSNLRLASGSGADNRPEINKAFMNGDIQKADYDKLMSEVEVNSAGPSGENSYKRGRQYITTTVLGANPDLATPSDKVRAAKTLDDWQSWSQAHPKATFSDAEKEYRQLADEAKIISIEELPTTVGIPRYMQGSKNNARSLLNSDNGWPALQNAMKATKEAYERGEIDAYERNRQGRILEAWEGLVQKPQPAQPGVK